jgi:hypothetical protein
MDLRRDRQVVVAALIAVIAMAWLWELSHNALICHLISYAVYVPNTDVPREYVIAFVSWAMYALQSATYCSRVCARCALIKLEFYPGDHAKRTASRAGCWRLSVTSRLRQRPATKPLPALAPVWRAGTIAGSWVNLPAGTSRFCGCRRAQGERFTAVRVICTQPRHSPCRGTQACASGHMLQPAALSPGAPARAQARAGKGEQAWHRSGCGRPPGSAARTRARFTER